MTREIWEECSLLRLAWIESLFETRRKYTKIHLWWSFYLQNNRSCADKFAKSVDLFQSSVSKFLKMTILFLKILGTYISIFKNKRINKGFMLNHTCQDHHQIAFFSWYPLLHPGLECNKNYNVEARFVQKYQCFSSKVDIVKMVI